jgi:hypothetical protein
MLRLRASYALYCLSLGCSGGGTGSEHGDQGGAGAASGGAVGSGGSGAALAGGSNGQGGSSAGGSSAGGASSGGTSTSGGDTGNTGGSSSGGSGIACGGSNTGGSGTADGTPGEWEDVTPAEIDLVSSYGVQDVLVDPVRPSDFYAFVCYQGVFKSTDFGTSWEHVSTGTGASDLETGRPWGAGIDTNPCRDPSTPPTLYTFSGYGAQSFWRSDDGGVNWVQKTLPEQEILTYDQDAYTVDVDPYDGKHIIIGFHEAPGMLESNDAGDTWTVIDMHDDMLAGKSWYGFFIDTGNAETTGQTWLLLPQQSEEVGTWRTSDGGTSWTKVENNEHPHGNSQIFQHQGVVYMSGVYGSDGWGVYRSTDLGVTWAHQGSNGTGAIVYGTPNNVYAQYAWANADGVEQTSAQKAPQPGTEWSNWSLPMSNGPKRASVTFDGTHYVVVSGNWNAGIWRYVEP